MDYYQQNNQPLYTPPKKNTFSVLSLIFGIASLVLLCTGLLPIPLGALGILFAVLSRRGRKMDSNAKTGTILSAIGLGTGLLFTILVYVFTFISLVQGILSNPDILNSDDPDVITDYMMESIYGEDYKEYFEQYGIDYDSMMDQMYDY